MRAHLVLKNAGAAPGMEAALPTAATIKSYLASPETIRKAGDAALQLGFKVVGATPLQVTIEGPKDHFEKVFASRLKAAAGSRQAAKKVGSGAGKKSAAKKKLVVDESPEQSQRWTWVTPPALPAEMHDAVAEIVLPQATALH